MVNFAIYIFYYVFLMIAGRLFFTLFFYKSYEAPSFGYASSSKRQLAFQLDIGCIFSLCFMLFILTNGIVSLLNEDIHFTTVVEFLQDAPMPPITYIISGLLLLIIYCIYSTICELTMGATIGKKFLSIQAVTLKYKRPLVAQLILRNCLKLISLLCAPVLVFVVYHDKKRQWLHDKFSYTVIIDTEKIDIES